MGLFPMNVGGGGTASNFVSKLSDSRSNNQSLSGTFTASENGVYVATVNGGAASIPVYPQLNSNGQLLGTVSTSYCLLRVYKLNAGQYISYSAGTSSYDGKTSICIGLLK